MDDAEDPGPVPVVDRYQQRCPAGLRDLSGPGSGLRLYGPAAHRHPVHDLHHRALADGAAGAVVPAEVDAAHAGAGAELGEAGVAEVLGGGRLEPVLLGQSDDGPAFRGLVGEGRQLGGIRELDVVDPGERDEGGCLAVAVGDGAGLVEEQGVHVAGRLNGAAAQRDDVALDEPVHAGDADRGEQGADRRRDEGDEQGDQDGRGLGGARIRGHRLDADHDQDEDDGQGCQQDVQRYLVRGLLPGGALDQRDHPVDEAVPGARGDPHDDRVRQDGRAPGDTGPVTARLPEHRGRFTGDGRLVHHRRAVDHVTVGRNQLPRLDEHEVERLEFGRGYDLGLGAAQVRPVGPVLEPERDRVRTRLAQRLGLGAAATFGDGLGEVGEQDRQPQPDADHPGEDRRVDKRRQRGQDRSDRDDEQHRLLHQLTRMELGDGLPGRGGKDLGLQHVHLAGAFPGRSVDRGPRRGAEIRGNVLRGGGRHEATFW